MINSLVVLLEKTEGLMAMRCVGETSPTLLGRSLQGRWELQPSLLVGSAGREGAERGPEHTRGLQPAVEREAETPAGARRGTAGLPNKCDGEMSALPLSFPLQRQLSVI